MAWTASILLDVDKPDVGTVTATWNAGQADAFTYACRLKVNLSEGRTFAAEAKAARRTKETRVTKQSALEKMLVEMMNAEEAKV